VTIWHWPHYKFGDWPSTFYMDNHDILYHSTATRRKYYNSIGVILCYIKVQSVMCRVRNLVCTSIVKILCTIVCYSSRPRTTMYIVPSHLLSYFHTTYYIYIDFVRTESVKHRRIVWIDNIILSRTHESHIVAWNLTLKFRTNDNKIHCQLFVR